MRKNEIIAKTLKQIDTCLFQYEVPYSQDSDWEDHFAGLQNRLPETNIWTWEDFLHLKVECCEICDELYPHYEISWIDTQYGSKAWVCEPVKGAIYSDSLRQAEQR